MDKSTPYSSPILRHLIRSNLTTINLWSDGAEELLLATCAQESLFGTYRTQGNNGPARGIFQCEKEDHDDIWNNYLAYHTELANQIRNIVACPAGIPDSDLLINNDPYAIAICRVHYLRAPEALPSPQNLLGIWELYKKRYNTPEGAATADEFYEHYHRFVTDGVAH